MGQDGGRPPYATRRCFQQSSLLRVSKLYFGIDPTVTTNQAKAFESIDPLSSWNSISYNLAHRGGQKQKTRKTAPFSDPALPRFHARPPPAQSLPSQLVEFTAKAHQEGERGRRGASPPLTFSSVKLRQPSRGTNAASFFPFLISCTRTHFRMAELGCFASIPLMVPARFKDWSGSDNIYI